MCLTRAACTWLRRRPGSQKSFGTSWSHATPLCLPGLLAPLPPASNKCQSYCHVARMPYACSEEEFEGEIKKMRTKQATTPNQRADGPHLNVSARALSKILRQSFLWDCVGRNPTAVARHFDFQKADIPRAMQSLLEPVAPNLGIHRRHWPVAVFHVSVAKSVLG